MPTESTPIYNVSTSQLNQLDLIYLIKTFVKKIVPHLDGNFIKIINKKKNKTKLQFYAATFVSSHSKWNDIAYNLKNAS